MQDPIFRHVEAPAVAAGPLAPMAEKAAQALKAAGQSVAVWEATTAGLVQAALQAVPGASAYTTCGAVTYSPKKGATVLGGVDLSAPRPTDAGAYKASKNVWTQTVARQMRKEVGATWCLSESGACGPTFNYPGLSAGFTAIFVSGPVEKGLIVESPHANREENMWSFAKLALDLLAECVAEAAAIGAAGAADEASPEPLLVVKEDRYGGVEVEVAASSAGTAVAVFEQELRRGLEAWQLAGKKGLWLKIPTPCAAFVGPAVTIGGFEYHHARPEYALLTRWLPATPSPLPKYAFTQIGVGGVVVNSKDEVLMVKEKVSPLPMFQGSWKLPGGLADPGEDFANTVQREVLEETGVTGTLEGVVSLRHTHALRFNLGDIYVLVKMRAEKEEISMDDHELLDARWMGVEEIKSLVVERNAPLDGKVSENNWKMISNALFGSLILGTELPNSRGPKASMLYTAPPKAVA
mmetsp:Transcript_80630/g.179092  ORF Transcript_80630/g.179092 Transcript_80630/m.179092 type:complete len:466 (-) Transcript_80630:72-1469(-)